MKSLRKLAVLLSLRSSGKVTPSLAGVPSLAGELMGESSGGTRHVRRAGRSKAKADRRRVHRSMSDLERLEGRSVLAASLFAGLPEALPRFDTVGDVKDFLVQKALKDYAYQFGQPTYGYYPMMMNDAVSSTDLRAPSSNNSAAGSVVPEHSTTNNQVAGVDEADLVETDGRYLYVARNGEVAIVSALSGISSDAGMEVVSRILIQGNVVGEFLAGDRLTVISTQWHGWGVDPMFGRMAVADLPYSPSMQSQSAVTVSVFDVGDPSTPTLLEQTKMDGEFLEARAIGDKVFVIVSNSDLALPPPRMICADPGTEPIPPEGIPPAGIPFEGDPGVFDGSDGSDGTNSGIYGGADGAAGEADPVIEWASEEYEPIAFASKPGTEPVFRTFGGGLMMAEPMVMDAMPTGRFAYWEGPSCVYEDRDAYLTGIKPRLDAIIDGLLPQYSTVDGQFAFVRGGSLHEPGDIIRPVNDETARLMSVVSFDVFDDQAGPIAAEAIPTSWASAFLATADHLYVFENDYSNLGSGQSTDILQFTWNTATGEVRATASGTVPGSTLSQFSADEHEGHLRVATTMSNFSDIGWSAENAVYVLEARGSELAVVGSVTGIAPDETIRSVRFAGDRGFVVTFRQIDPFFTLDLSDPTQPKVVGELKIPGYSSYLQVLDDTHVVGIGRVDIGDWQWRVQVSVFDVSNFADPRRIGLYTFDETVMGSPAEWEHLAFLWVPSLKLLAFPVNAGRSTAPEGSLPYEEPILIEDGSFIGDSIVGGDMTDALIADGEDDGSSSDNSDASGDTDGGDTDYGETDYGDTDVGNTGDGYAEDGSGLMEKGEPMMFTTTSMPLDYWYSQYEDLSGLAFLRVDFDAADESSGLVFEGIVQQRGTVRSVWIGDHVYAVAPSGILALDASAGHELAGSLDLGPEPGAFENPILFPAVYWRGMEPLMASAGQSVETSADTAVVDPAASPSPWDDTTLSDVLRIAIEDLATQLETPPDSIRLVTAECSGIDENTGEHLYDLVFAVNGERHHVHAVVATDGSVTVEQFTPNYEFSTQAAINEWHNEAEPCDVDGDGLVAPIDALNVINELNVKGSYRLGGDRPMRSILARPVMRRSAFEPVRIRFDASGDSLLAPIDALLVINRINGQTVASGQSASGQSAGVGGEGESLGRSSESAEFGGSSWMAASWLAAAAGLTDGQTSSISNDGPSANASPSTGVSKLHASTAFRDAAIRDGVLAGWDVASEGVECLGAIGNDGLSAPESSVDENATDAAFAGAGL